MPGISFFLNPNSNISLKYNGYQHTNPKMLRCTPPMAQACRNLCGSVWWPEKFVLSVRWPANAIAAKRCILHPAYTVVKRRGANLQSATVFECNCREEEHNREALEDPYQVNQDPYGKGWLCFIECEEWKTESGNLITGETVEAWSEKEMERYRSQGWID